MSGNNRGFGVAVPDQTASHTRRYTSTNSFLIPAINTSLQAPNWHVATVYDKPTPTVVSVNLLRVVSTNAWQTSLHLFAGGQQIAVPIAQCMMVIEYGVGAFARRICADAKSGSYQLPPATQVKVGFIPYVTNGAWASTDDFQAMVAVSPGVTAQPARLVYTESATVVGSGGIGFFISPNGARWVDVWASNSTVAAGQPILSLLSSQNAGAPLIVRDYTTGTYSPPWGPVECAPAQGTNFRVTNTGTADTGAVVRSFLEL